MEGPSRELCQRLAAWNLCGPQDIGRCDRFVRTLSRDLPMFDSVWIDALVRARVISPFQGKTLDSPAPDRLRIGPCILVEPLGEDSWRRMYRAQRMTTREPCMVTVLHPYAEDASAAFERIEELIKRLIASRCGSIVRPSDVYRGAGFLAVVSGDVRGQSLHEFLVRRGRFPAAVVLAIARHLAAAARELEHCGLAHSDIRARNVRLDLNGDVHLLNSGLLAAAIPDFAVRPQIPLDVCDGLAPEQIRENHAPDSRSDTYALGCLLWQLLAGRPRFPTGDPHSKIACHLTRAAPDVREYAPQTPVVLSKLIRAATAKDAADRPTLDELLAWIGPPGARDRQRLKRFAGTFQGEAPHQTTAVTSSPRFNSSWAVALFLFAGIAIWLSGFGFPNELLRIGDAHAAAAPARSQSGPQKTSPARETVATPASLPPTPTTSLKKPPEKTRFGGTLPLPAPEAGGRILLAADATYAARPLNVQGPVSIRCVDGTPARLIISAPWEIVADSIQLEGLDVTFASPAAEEAGILKLQCHALEATRCRFSASTAPRAAIEWRPTDASRADVGGMRFDNCVFEGAGAICPVRPSRIDFRNCLKTGSTPLIRLGSKGRAHGSVQVHLQRTTLRSAGSLVSFEPGSRSAGLGLSLTADSCVFEIAPNAALIEIASNTVPADWTELLRIQGAESVITPDSRMIGLAGNSGELDVARLNVEGVLQGNVQFHGRRLDSVADCVVTATDAVRSAAALPGIEPAALSPTQ